MCRKSFCVAGAIFWRRFQKTGYIFRGRRGTLEFRDLHCHFVWQSQRVRRVELRVFLWIALSGLRGNNVQISWRGWHFVRCDEHWRRLRTKHRFWGCRFWGSLGKFVGKRRFWSYKMWKLAEILTLLEAPTCLVSILWFSSAVAVSIGESAKPFIFQGFQTGYNVVSGGRRGRRGISWHSPRVW